MKSLHFTLDDFIIFKPNGDDSAKRGYCSCLPQKHAEGYAHITTIIANVRDFSYKHIIQSDTSTYINTSSNCFPQRTVTVHVESTINCWFFT